jgi:RNA polymerase sigma-70 factor (ECF subfamily)
MIPESPNPEITRLLKRAVGGDRVAEGELFTLLYRDLHSIAKRHMRSERSSHTLQPTALLHEAYFKLIEIRSVDWQDRAHFLSMAARTMRRVLISHARTRNAKKRHHMMERIDLDSVAVFSTESPEQIILFDEAMEKLREKSVRACEVVELHFFVGLPLEEVAASLKVASRTVKRDWRTAKEFLAKEMYGRPSNV